MLNPPPGVGSGKFATPCSRMHREYATAWAPGAPALDDALLEPADELLEEVLDLALDPS